MATLPNSLVLDLIDTLERTPCQFWACPGPNKPPKDMATCMVCATLRRFRRAVRHSGVKVS